MNGWTRENHSDPNDVALQIELEGRLPWQRVRPSDGPHAAKD
jgi:hypothetical protein